MAVRSDLSLIQEMENVCFKSHDRFKRKQIQRLLTNPEKSVMTDVVLYGGKPAGWACYLTRKNSSLVRLYTMCILPEFGGKGCATVYLKKRISEMKKYRVMALEVREENRKAIALYGKLGFKISRSLPGYYPDGKHGRRMVLDLTPRRSLS